MERSFSENLECVLGTELPRPQGLHDENDQQQVDCGICYAQFLPTGDFSNPTFFITTTIHTSDSGIVVC